MFADALAKKKPWYKRWWFILYCVVFVISIGVLVLFSQQTNTLLSQIPDPGDGVLTNAGLVQDQVGNDASFTTLPDVQIESAATSEAVPAHLLLTENSPWLGNPDAALVIVEFSDFECPFCRQASPILRQLLTRYPDDVMLVYRHFPIGAIHPMSTRAAEASQCAHDQGRFWQYHDVLFEHQGDLAESALFAIAREAGVNEAQLRDCLDSGKYTQLVQQDFNTGLELGVVGTPTFFVNGFRVAGVVPIETWEEIVLVARAINQ